MNDFKEDTAFSALSEILIDTGFPLFADRIKERLKRGAKEYGDESLYRDPLELIQEVEEELIDICGWSWILFERIQRTKTKLKAIAEKSAKK